MDIILKVVLPLGLAFIMFSLGLGLSSDDFKRVLKQPTAFFIGAFNQVFLLPVITFVLILAFSIRGEIAVGFMILAACPGGVTSNILSKFANADVALSVTLTAIISLATVLTVPFILDFSFGYFLDGASSPISIFTTSVTMFALTVVPIALALLLQKLFPQAMRNAAPICSKISSALFVIILCGAIAANWEIFLENLQLFGVVIVSLLAILMGLGLLTSILLGLTFKEAKTISIETGIQNGTLGIAVAGLLAGAGGELSILALPSAIYGVLMYIVALPAIFLFRKIES